MTQSLALLLGEAFDYAGLFAPVQKSLPEAVEEYGTLLESPSEWLVNSFICPLALLPQLETEAQKVDLFEAGEPLGVIVTMSPEDGLTAQAAVSKVMATFGSSAWLQPIALEVKLPPNADGLSWLSPLKKAGQELEIPVMLELGWSDAASAFRVDAIVAWDDFGFKARSGSEDPSQTPSSEQLAAFIAECAGMDCPFKFTAGLHQPLRHHDPLHGGWRHGFLNVLGASLAAIAGDAGVKELTQILDYQGAGAFAFGDTSLMVGGTSYSLEDIEMAGGYCFGIGSCSIDEPYEALIRMGLIEPEGDN